MKKAKFLVSHFDAGAVKFQAGESYPLDEETRLCIVRGAAEEVEAPNVEPPAATEATAATAPEPVAAPAAAKPKAK